MSYRVIRNLRGKKDVLLQPVPDAPVVTFEMAENYIEDFMADMNHGELTMEECKESEPSSKFLNNKANQEIIKKYFPKLVK